MQRREFRLDQGEAQWRCAACESWKPASAYRRTRWTWNGLTHYCRDCLRERDRKRQRLRYSQRADPTAA